MRRQSLDLAAAMRSLYETTAHLVSLEPEVGSGFQEDYWHQVADPDGKRRIHQVLRHLIYGEIQSERRVDREAMLPVGSAPHLAKAFRRQSQ